MSSGLVVQPTNFSPLFCALSQRISGSKYLRSGFASSFFVFPLVILLATSDQGREDPDLRISLEDEGKMSALSALSILWVSCKIFALPEESSCFPRSVEVASVKLSVVSWGLTEWLIQLELEDDADKVPGHEEHNVRSSDVADAFAVAVAITSFSPDVRCVRCYVIFRGRIKVPLGPGHGRDNPLIAEPKLPPPGVHVPDTLCECVPPPLVDDVSKRQVDYFLQGDGHKVVYVSFWKNGQNEAILFFWVSSDLLRHKLP